MEAPEYAGNCVDILDNNSLFSDATEMAQTVEAGDKHPLERKEFRDLVGRSIPRGCADFSRNGNILIAYNPTKDIHHFWTSK